MASITTKSDNIRRDQSLKSDAKFGKKVETKSNSTKSVQKSVVKNSVQKSPNFNKSIVNKTNTNVNKNKIINKTDSNVKQGLELESRTSLQQKIKYLEQDLQKYDLERSRITEELDRVCEQKDNQIRQLKTELHEKQLEIDHQIYSFRKTKNEFEEELNGKGFEIQNLKIEFQNQKKDLIDKKESLEKQLFELRDYIKNKDQTLAKIRELQEINEKQNSFHQRVREKLINEVENEKLKVEELVAKRVNEIQECLETSCMKKLSIDARIALQKFEELSKSYELCEQECRQLRKDSQILKTKLHNQRIRTEVSESLLNEWLKQINRKLQNRKHIGLQTQFKD